MSEHLSELELKQSFEQGVVAIENRQLTPENITSYADSALSDLISLSADIVRAYRPGRQGPVTKLDEADAFNHFELRSLESVIDHVAQVANEIDALDSIVARAHYDQKVFVPTDSIEVQIEKGDGTFKEHERVDRLKSVLFVLSKDFGVDIDSASEVEIASGAVEGTMMRQSGYFSLIIPELDRQVLVCDEKGNATYVFDTSKIEEYLQEADVRFFTKNELNALIHDHVDVGVRLVYSNDFLVNMKSYLGGQFGAEVSDERKKSNDYLRGSDEPAEGYASLKMLQHQYGISQKIIHAAASSIKADLGEVAWAKFNTTNARAYSPDQQAMIHAALEARGAFTESVREGYLSVGGMAREFGLAYMTVDGAVQRLGDELGEIAQMRYRSGVGKAFSPQQQELIRAALEADNKFAKTPEGYKSVAAMAHEIGVADGTVARAISSLRDELGEVVQSKFYSNIVDAYSPQQQLKIREFFERKELLVMPAPEGYVSRSVIYKALNIGSDTFQAAVEDLAESLGEVRRMRFGSYSADGFSADQRQIITEYVEKQKANYTEIRDDEATISGLAIQLNVAHSTIKTAMRNLGDELGLIRKARIANNVVEVFTLEQQEMIYLKLKENKRVANLGQLARSGSSIE